MSLELQTDVSVYEKNKITEKSEKARREFFSKVEKLTKQIGSNNKLVDEIADQAANEYNKIFGRVGIHPLLGLKNGKKKARYILDRDEVWVLYKPALWQMGGSQFNWDKNLQKRAQSNKSLTEAQTAMLKSEEMESLQEWHGLMQGTKWVDKEQPVQGWGFIQRLDVETDGPVVCCKTWREQRCLQAQMREHIFSKGYLCLVHGRLENKIHVVQCKFAELGSDQGSAVMLKHDADNNPFFNVERARVGTRMAETFVKPIAYYSSKTDGKEYSLCYCNILTGITHQVRITMQSLGHPLVSDDRYLPKDQAMADLHWCPRNFLTEVRADWFDFCGPFKDPKRKRYERISIENPLPKLFQTVLETKLNLVEKLDPTADLYVGPQYWALGDEQLMMAHPKDDEYRKKVMRWGQRKKIHLEALDRLLLLPKTEIDKILTGYRGPKHRDEETWLCPVCMTYNKPDKWGKLATTCTGGAGVGKDCPGKRINDPDEDEIQIGKGFMDWLSDPTLHLLFVVNVQWLEARRQILKFPRPSWEKLPPEVEGTPASTETLRILEDELIRNLREGGHGIHEEDIPKLPGMPTKLKMPLSAIPETSNVQRVRLPAHGTHSQWTYTLKGKARVAITEKFELKTEKMTEPLEVVTEALPERMHISDTDRRRKKIKKEKDQEAKKDAEEKKKAEDEAKEAKQAKKKAEEKERKRIKEEIETEKSDKKRKRWEKRESKSAPGKFYYFNSFTGESVAERPPDYEDPGGLWERVESTSAPGKFYYFNRQTGENSEKKPEGGIIIGEDPESKKKKQKVDEPEVKIDWTRVESSSNPGKFYYFNPVDGTNHVYPPTVAAPWKLLESKSNQGQFYYWNENTASHQIDPPNTAKPSKVYPPGSSLAKPEVQKSFVNGTMNGGATKAKENDPLPPGWRVEMSSKHKKNYYVNTKTGATVWEKPSIWEKKSSSSHPGKFYYVHMVSGETRWENPNM